MNRRRAIVQISAFSLGFAGISFGGWQYYRLFRKPELGDLARHESLISSLVDTIIPSNETPGAREAQVAEYVAMMVREALSRKEQNNFIYGLNELKSSSESTYGRPFEECSASEKNEILNDLEVSTTRGIVGKVQKKLMGRSFYHILKSLTIEGFCTSELGATKHLSYQYIPGIYISCTDLAPNQRSWATK